MFMSLQNREQGGLFMHLFIHHPRKSVLCSTMCQTGHEALDLGTKNDNLCVSGYNKHILI